MSSSRQLPLGYFAPPLRPELSQWHSPDWLARRMVVDVYRDTAPTLRLPEWW